MSIAINVFLSFIHKISVILCFCKNTLTSEVILMYKPRYSDNMNSHSGLIDADISAFEYCVSLPSDVKEPVRRCRKMSAHSKTAVAAVTVLASALSCIRSGYYIALLGTIFTQPSFFPSKSILLLRSVISSSN